MYTHIHKNPNDDNNNYNILYNQLASVYNLFIGPSYISYLFNYNGFDGSGNTFFFPFGITQRKYLMIVHVDSQLLGDIERI